MNNGLWFTVALSAIFGLLIGAIVGGWMLLAGCEGRALPYVDQLDAGQLDAADAASCYYAGGQYRCEP